MHLSSVFLSVTLILSTGVTAPVNQQPIEDTPAAHYPFKKDPYDRKHDTYGDGVQPLPVVRREKLW